MSPTGSTAFGAGIANYSATPAQDTTYATPWGTTNTASGWSSQFQTRQLIEVGLNLTRIGIDPALYSALNPCQSMFSNIFFKSRSSSSFTANLQDFVAPLTFLRPPVMDFSIKGDTLRCNHTTGSIVLTNNTTAANYTWKAISGGTITGANSDSSSLSINKPGSYIVSASPAQGCPATAVDTIVVPIDTFPPVASAISGLLRPHILLFGGNASASNYSTPFGGSQGLTWSWTGPNSFTSTVQNPITDTTWGLYTLTVTEKRNGCTATASTNVLAASFTTLLADALQLHGNNAGQAVDLGWSDLDQSIDLSFTVERSDGINNFQPIGNVQDQNAYGDPLPGAFAYTDSHPLAGNNFYRVRATTIDGRTYYSPVIGVANTSSKFKSIYLVGNDPHRVTLAVQAGGNAHAVLAAYSLSGQTLGKRSAELTPGANMISLSGINGPSVSVIVLYLDGQVAWSQKILR